MSAQRVVVTAEDGAATTPEAMLAALKKWCVVHVGWRGVHRSGRSCWLGDRLVDWVGGLVGRA